MDSDSHGGAENMEQSSSSNDPTTSASTSLPSDALTVVQPEESKESLQEPNLEEDSEVTATDDQQLELSQIVNGNMGSTDTEKIAGIAIVLCMLAGSVAFFVFKRKR